LYRTYKLQIPTNLEYVCVDEAWHQCFTKWNTLSGLVLQLFLSTLKELRYSTNSNFLFEQQAAQC